MPLFHEYVIVGTLAQFRRGESGDLGFNISNKNANIYKQCFFASKFLKISQEPVDGETKEKFQLLEKKGGQIVGNNYLP